jgi:hypothetical protein
MSTHAIIGMGISGSLLAGEIAGRADTHQFLLTVYGTHPTSNRPLFFYSATQYDGWVPIHSTWKRTAAVGKNWATRRTSASGTWHLVYEQDLYRAADALMNTSAVRHIPEWAERIKLAQSEVCISTASTQSQYDIAFDSGDLRSPWSTRQFSPAWTGVSYTVTAKENCFNPSELILTDKRGLPPGWFAFTAPLSAAVAHVQLCSAGKPYSEKICRSLLKSYLESVGCTQFRVQQDFCGLTTQRFQIASNPVIGGRLFAIGAKGGCLSAATGFGFSSMLTESQSIANALAEKSRIRTAVRGPLSRKFNRLVGSHNLVRRTQPLYSPLASLSLSYLPLSTILWAQQ